MSESQPIFPEPGPDTLEALRTVFHDLYDDNPNWTQEGIERVAVLMAGFVEGVDVLADEQAAVDAIGYDQLG